MRTNTLLILLLFCSACVCAQSARPDYGNNIANGGYKKVNGINLYYEIYGEGKPLVLLHGNGGSINKQADRIDYFSKYFKIIAIDSRAHGKSIDTSHTKLTYELMASDVNLLLDSLHIDSAYVWGQSDGGIIGLLLAIKYQNKTAKVSTFGANIFPGKKAIFDEIDDLVLDTVRTTKNAYRKKLYELMAEQPNITEKQLSEIKCPVLIMSGDRDAIRLEHSVKIFGAIPNSNLFIMPGATHFGAYTKTALFNMVLLDFFNSPFSKVSTVELFTGKH
jgi:pimeloyl-ACP methyl ester carboxylesterase